MGFENKVKSTDRIIELAPVEGKKALASSGLADPRLFTGENKLHAFEQNDGLWALRYEHGILEEPLRQRFTNFTKLMDFVIKYYKKRNIEVKEVID